MSPRNHNVSLAEPQYHIIDPTNPCGALDDGVEHRLHVSRRAADDAEHLGGRRLMLQRLAQFRVALLDFFEQPHVLDGDHRLIGEGFKQIDLPVGERTDFLAANIDRPDRNTLAQQRRCKVVRTPIAIPRVCASGKSFQSPQGHEHESFPGQG